MPDDPQRREQDNPKRRFPDDRGRGQEDDPHSPSQAASSREAGDEALAEWEQQWQDHPKD